MNFYERVYEAVSKIPRGRVATYGQVASMSGNPRAARAVGSALHVNPYPGIIPCHRVVNKQGRLAPAFAFGGKEVQSELLRAEGVKVGKDFHVDMEKYEWRRG